MGYVTQVLEIIGAVLDALGTVNIADTLGMRKFEEAKNKLDALAKEISSNATGRVENAEKKVEEWKTIVKKGGK